MAVKGKALNVGSDHALTYPCSPFSVYSSVRLSSLINAGRALGGLSSSASRVLHDNVTRFLAKAWSNPNKIATRLNASCDKCYESLSEDMMVHPDVNEIQISLVIGRLRPAVAEDCRRLLKLAKCVASPNLCFGFRS